MGWQLLVRRNYPAVQGQILTTADSAVTDLRQLVDEEVVFPGREAFIAYKVTYAHLLANQIPVKVVFGGNLIPVSNTTLAVIGAGLALGAFLLLKLAKQETLTA